MPLTSPAVSETTMESASLALFQEWLASYFDGGSHPVGFNAPQVFPQASLRFQQSAQPQPLNGVGITMVWVRPSRIEYEWDTVGGTRQQVAYADAAWMFFVRAELQESGTGNARSVAMTTGELLFALLQNSKSTLFLAEKGIHHLRPESPQLVSEGSGSKSPDLNFSVRMLSCTGRVRFTVRSQS